ncbi:MAG: hypothetical protein M3Y85_09230 [Bacteroidota bacterium]|nr:hypothetical protein [Bacteroidota bacterium]
MEKQIKARSFSYRFIFKIVCVSLLMSVNLSVLQAQTNITKTSPAEIKYVGVKDEQLIFQVDFLNEASETFTIEVKDQNGYQLYEGKFKSSGFRKQFAVNKVEMDNNSLVFVITTKSNRQKQVFDVNATSRVIEEVSVVKN